MTPVARQVIQKVKGLAVNPDGFIIALRDKSFFEYTGFYTATVAQHIPLF